MVDPDVFYDKDNNLWMVYGSYSGGIFIMKMDPVTGMPMPGEVSGTWTLTRDLGFQLVIDNVTYDGVFSRQWDIGTGKHVFTFTAMSLNRSSDLGSSALISLQYGYT